MYPGPGAGGGKGGHVLGHEAGDKPGQHVAGPSRGQRRRRIAVDDGVALGVCYHRIGPLEKDHGAATPRRRAHPRQLALLLHVAEQAPELAFMGGQHTGRTYGIEQDFRRLGKHAEGVGIEDTGPSRPQHRQHPRPGLAADAVARTQKVEILALVGQQAGKGIETRQGNCENA